MEVMVKFLMWFVISLPILIAVESIVPRKIFFSFIVALIFGFLAVKGDQNE